MSDLVQAEFVTLQVAPETTAGTLAAASWKDAWDGESDRSPTYLTPRIRGYTR